MPPSIQGVPTFQHERLTHSRASRLSRQPITTSTSRNRPRPTSVITLPWIGVTLTSGLMSRIVLGRGDRLALAAVFVAKQDRAREVAVLDLVESMT